MVLNVYPGQQIRAVANRNHRCYRRSHRLDAGISGGTHRTPFLRRIWTSPTRPIKFTPTGWASFWKGLNPPFSGICESERRGRGVFIFHFPQSFPDAAAGHHGYQPLSSMESRRSLLAGQRSDVFSAGLPGPLRPGPPILRYFGTSKYHNPPSPRHPKFQYISSLSWVPCKQESDNK